jgi:hypothetical protein
MRWSDKIRAAPVLTTIALAICFAVSCRNPARPPALEPAIAPAGEPETYTATIVRSIEDGQHQEITETRVARSGDMRRQEWKEAGERWAFITHFDSGKSFTLNLSRQTFIEADLEGVAVEKPKTRSAEEVQNSTDVEKQRSATGQQTSAMDFVEDSFAEQPTSLENRALPDEYIANELCKVAETRASFTDGRTEVTRIFRAQNLSGLALKTERETSSSTQRTKVVTEWRDIKLGVSPDDFVIPANFKKVQSFSAP